MATERLAPMGEPIRELTEAEEFEYFDRQARARLNMSGQEFMAAWDAGKFRGQVDTPDVLYVAMLRPLGR